MSPAGDPLLHADVGDGGEGLGSELEAFVGILRRRRWIVALCTFVGVAAAVALALTTPKVYQGTFRIQVNAPPGAGESSSSVQQANITRAKQYATYLTDGNFLRDAAPRLALRPRLGPSGLAGRVSASSPQDSSFLTLRVEGSSPAEARATADALGRYFVRTETEQATARAAELTRDQQAEASRLRAQIDELSQQLAKTQSQAEQAGLQFRQSSLQNDLNQVNQSILATQAASKGEALALVPTGSATAPSTPISPRPVLNVVVGLLFGLIVGLVLAWVRDQLDRRVRDQGEVERALRHPVLATIPVDRVHRSLLDGALANAFDVLRVNLAMTRPGSGPRVYAVTSAREGEGKTFSTIGLGRAFARAGRRVVVVDADLRRRGLSLALETDDRPGLTELLLGEGSLEREIVRPGDGLDILPAGSGDARPPTLLDSRAFDDVLAGLRRLYDVVIVDTPPILHMADSVLVASRCDGVLAAVRLGTVTRPELRALGERLNGAAFEVLGEIVHSPEADATEYSAYDVSPPRGRRMRLGRGSSIQRRARRTRRAAQDGEGVVGRSRRVH